MIAPTSTPAVKADDIVHILRDRIALQPGCRDRYGRAALFFPSIEQVISAESIRNVLLYLSEVTEDASRQKGFLVLIDMRGKRTWSTVKPLLKGIEDLGEVDTFSVHSVLIIKPEKFWEKQKAQISLGSWSFEVQMINFDQLNKFIEVQQIPREIGGTYPYDHDEWLETRLELEKWIWQMTEILRGLSVHESTMTDGEQPVDVASAMRAMEQHHRIRSSIQAIPLDRIRAEADRIIGRIDKPICGARNPDLEAAKVNIRNLVHSLQMMKEKVFTSWEKRNSELGVIHDFKLYEQDADRTINWIRTHSKVLNEHMSDIGSNEREALERLQEFDGFETSARNNEVSVNQVCTRANRLLAGTTPQHRGKVERLSLCLSRDWEQFKSLLEGRRKILTTAVAFFRCTSQYFSQYSCWLENPGVNVESVDGNDQGSLDDAINRHLSFWNQVETVYCEAVSQSSQLLQALRGCNADASQCTNMNTQLTRSQKQLHDIWNTRKMKLHSLLAFIAFKSDIKLVIDWLNEHGDTYLRRNVKIGDSRDSAIHCQRSHNHFRRIAENTFLNATKLFNAGVVIVNSGVVDQERMRAILRDLEERVQRFTARLEARNKLLNMSVLFHTHYNELLDWYATMERKYDKSVACTVKECNDNREQWILESDGTAQAYATTMGEGNDLIKELQRQHLPPDFDFSETVLHVSRLMEAIEKSNHKLLELWVPQRTLLEVGAKFANFLADCADVLEQILSWRRDMRAMLDDANFASNAHIVQPFHAENTNKVKEAIKSIKLFAREVLQFIHGNQFDDVKVKGREELVVDMIRNSLRQLENAEQQVMKVAKDATIKIDGAVILREAIVRTDALVKFFDESIDCLYENNQFPKNYDESVNMLEDHKRFRSRVSSYKSGELETFLTFTNELIRENQSGRISIERNSVIALNENVISKWRLLVGLTEERNKLLLAAVACFKTYHKILLPLLKQLDKEEHVDDWCQKCNTSSTIEKANYLSNLISQHTEYKEKFLKGCSYALKNSETYLKHIQRDAMNNPTKSENESMINEMKSHVRERQSKIMEIWNRKKRHLDRCYHFVLYHASCSEIFEWIGGEGEVLLRNFSGKVKNSNDTALLELFVNFKIMVKEKRATIQTLLCMGNNLFTDAIEHKNEFTEIMDDLKSRFEQFSQKVNDCEVVLRGTKITRNELSLNRHSDSSVEERMDKEHAKITDERKQKMMEPMQELIKSEKDYIEDLCRCVQVYIKEYDTASTSGTLPIALVDRRKEIFGNMELLYKFHSETFIGELKKYENEPEDVGCSFILWVDCLNDLYTEYCVNKEQNANIISLPDALQFFGGVREKNSLEISNDLGSLLIKPVQRITRYRLMMEQLMRNSTENVEEIKEAYEVVLSVPRRVNDIIHLNCLDKSKLGVLGPFVMQDFMTIWEPRTYFKKGKERQVFLFELAIVFAKKIEMPSKAIRYVAKGKPISLGEVSVVEHVEGDVSRFGLRVGTIATNENRTDLRANSEQGKVMWVKKIRELTQGLLPLGLKMGIESTSSLNSAPSSARSVSARSNVSSSSGDRLSRDVELFSLENQRLSIQSTDSCEQGADQWIISSDFQPTTEGQLAVQKGEKVEIVEQQPSDTTDWIQVYVVDNPSRTGLVPSSILLPDQPSSSTDRPEPLSSSSVTKRKSLRRIFANSAKQPQNRLSASTVPVNTLQSQPQQASSSFAGSTNPDNQSSSSCTVLSGYPTTGDNQQSGTVPLIVSSVPAVNSVDDEALEGLPPPMEEISHNDSAHLNEDQSEQSIARESVEEECSEKQEKTPEEIARFKRHYVLMELVETEQDYVKDLTSVVEGYIANLNSMELPAELQGKDKIIFANIAQILDFHKNSFLKEIEKCIDNYDAAGAAFVKYERRLHTLYVKYCQNKPKSDYLVSQDEFEVFFAETKAKLGHKVALCDLLIKPVQRIMKYQLLLKDVLKFTERAKDNTNTLKKALEVMHVVPKACDDMMQVGRLQNFDGNLNAQGRLIHQGTLSIAEQCGNNTQRAKDRRIFLFEQSAIIADHIPPKKEFGNPTYIFKNQIMVNKMLFQKIVANDEPLKFSLGSTDMSQPNFIAIAQNSEEKEEWVRKLEDMQDQQKRMLEQLVNPKKYISGGNSDDLGLGSMSLSNDKKSPGAIPRPTAPGSASLPKAGSSKPESPKKDSKSKLFSFGKKPSAKSPTSPPPEKCGFEAVVICNYVPLRPGEIAVKIEEEVSVLSVENGYASIRTVDGKVGRVPSYFLELNKIEGETFAEQIQFRRSWYERISEIDLKGLTSNPLSTFGTHHEEDYIAKQIQQKIPVITKDISDILVREGEKVIFQPTIISPVEYSLTWRGPALEKKRAIVENDGKEARLVIPTVGYLDSGPYSFVASNSHGSVTSVALLKVVRKPEAPVNLKLSRTGWRSVKLNWTASSTPGVRYCIQFKRPDMASYWSACIDLTATKVTLRQFRPCSYKIRVFAYTVHFRSDYTNEICVDFSLEPEKTKELTNDIGFGSVLGCGRTSITYDMLRNANPIHLAGKVFSKKRKYEEIQREVSILNELCYPNIPQFHGFFESEKGYCILLQRIPGIDIAKYVEKLGYLTEDVLQLLCRYIFEILSYLHSKGIVYTDMKPENLLVEDRVVLIDFGSAQKKDSILQKKTKNSIESVYWGDSDATYSAPERSQGFSPCDKSDVWAVGSIICHLCFGEAPHRAAPSLKRAQDRFSTELLGFLNSILACDPSKRLSAAEALKHEWMHEIFLTNLPKMGERSESSADDVYLVVEKPSRLSRSASFDWS
ncbi:unnamed protein product [Auanema sp. JU1783]|nr:unnamed protein product [Auanema sp. JU1783]